MNKIEENEVTQVVERISINGNESNLTMKVEFNRKTGNGSWTIKKLLSQTDIQYDSANEVIRRTLKRMMEVGDNMLAEKRHAWNETNPTKDPDQKTLEEGIAEAEEEQRAAIGQEQQEPDAKAKQQQKKQAAKRTPRKTKAITKK